MKTLRVLLLLSLVIGGPAYVHADGGSINLICRGANRPLYEKFMKRAVRQKLDASNVAYRRISVKFGTLSRPRGTFSPDLLSGLVLGDGATPTVTYTGSFPAPDVCVVTGKLKISVVYESGRSLTLTDVSLPGTMLRSGNID